MELLNNRKDPIHTVKHEHLKLNQVIEEAQRLNLSMYTKYLYKDKIPPSPEPGFHYFYKDTIPSSPEPEFHVSRLKHDTTREGLIGIKCDGGFKYRFDDKDPLVWWSLSVGPEEVKSAETRLLEKKFPDRTEEQVADQQSFLWKFTTSPAFLQTSMLGSYRFTFPLQEVLSAYSHKFCHGAPPVMRVYKTMLFKQEVVHAVLVHSPDNQTFSEYPLLTDDPNAICVYRDGHFIWRPEAMSETHKYQLDIKDDQQQMEAVEVEGYPQFYVWNQVAIALHMEGKKVLEFDNEKLRENLKFCDIGEARCVREGETVDNFEEAKNQVRKLWPDWSSPLEKELSLQQSFTGPQHHLDQEDPQQVWD